MSQAYYLDEYEYLWGKKYKHPIKKSSGKHVYNSQNSIYSEPLNLILGIKKIFGMMNLFGVLVSTSQHIIPCKLLLKTVVSLKKLYKVVPNYACWISNCNLCFLKKIDIK